MKIDVTRLKEGVTENFQESLKPEEFDLGTSEVKYKGSIDISAEVKKDMQVVWAETHFRAMAEFTCSRCLKECDQLVEKDFNTQYPIEESQQFIDITQDIRQEIILGHPLKFLCKADCKGLCFSCGQDLNTGKCSCKNN